MKQHDGEEYLKELEMAKKRDHKIMITDEAIKKIPKIQYKYIHENEYDTIQELARMVLQISKDENNSNEVAITYCMDSTKYVQEGEKHIGIALGNEHEVDPISNTDAYHIVTSAKECIVIVLHNHPSLSTISLPDVRFLLEHASVKMMVAVTNLGSISYLVKADGYSFENAVTLFNEAVSMSNEAGKLKKVRKAAGHFLKNCHSVGIVYDDR